jgi:hypothetical protein
VLSEIFSVKVPEPLPTRQLVSRVHWATEVDREPRIHLVPGVAQNAGHVLAQCLVLA